MRGNVYRPLESRTLRPPATARERAAAKWGLGKIEDRGECQTAGEPKDTSDTYDVPSADDLARILNSSEGCSFRVYIDGENVVPVAEQGNVDMAFMIEGETDEGEYFIVSGIDSFADLQEWLEFLESEFGMTDSDWEYEGGD